MNRGWVVALGHGLGLIWAVALLGGALAFDAPFMPINVALIGAMVGPGLVLAAMIGVVGMRRLSNPALGDGSAPPAGTPAWVDRAVLQNTVEQTVLALALWPLAALALGGVVALALGLAFVPARLFYWLGYRLSPKLRGFGFAATFYPTLLATFWAIYAWAT